MAKPFFSLEEASARLNISADEVKELVRTGALREFRDAGKVFFRAEDVEKLAGGGRKHDSGEITLESVDDDLTPLGSGGSRAGSGMIDLEPAPSRPKKDDTVITTTGITAFEDEELEAEADPLAKTQITTGATSDELSLEGTGSGSGLLDLTREADDTSLGAELLDEIYPGEEEAAPAPAAPPRREERAPAAAVVEPVAPPEPVVSVAAPGPAYAVSDPLEGLFGGLLAAALLALALGACVVGGVLQGFVPDYALFLSDRFLIFLAGAVLVAGLAALIGWFLGRPSAPRNRVV